MTNPADLAAQAKSLALSYAVSMHNLVQPNDTTRAKRDELHAAIDALATREPTIPEGQITDAMVTAYLAAQMAYCEKADRDIRVPSITNLGSGE
jgi:hypothetical protein